MHGNLKFRYVVFEYYIYEIIKFGLKWVHVARYELILKLDGALWLRIISNTPLTPRRAIKIQNQQTIVFSPGEKATKVRAPSVTNRVSNQYMDLNESQHSHEGARVMCC